MSTPPQQPPRSAPASEQSLDVDIRLYETTIKRKLFITIGVLKESIVTNKPPDQVSCVVDSQPIAEELGKLTQGKNLIAVMLALDWLADQAFVHHLENLPEEEKNLVISKIEQSYMETLTELAMSAKKRLIEGKGACPKCDKLIPLGSHFCPYCKVKLKPKAKTPPPDDPMVQ